MAHVSWRIAARRRLHEARQGYRIYSQRLWFYPLLFVAAALTLYAATTVLDRAISLLVDDSETNILFVFTGGADAARSVLGSIATAWTTILGVVFSLTAVILQLASNKYTSELIPRIRRDSITQMTLGSLVGTVVYSLMVLSTVRTSSGPGGDFVPYIGVTLALVFAGIALLLTITFIAHLSRQIQGDFLTSGLAKDGVEALDRLTAPTGWTGVRVVDPPEKPARAREHVAVTGVRDGYVQGIDWGPLLWALRHALRRAPEGCSIRVDLERSINDRLYRGDRLGRVALEADDKSNETAELGAELAAWIRTIYELSSQRTVQRDVYYALEQLSDTGVKMSQNGDVDVVRGCLAGLTKLYGAISDRQIPHAVEITEGENKAIVSIAYRPLRRGVLRSLERFFSQSLSMRYESAVETFFYDTAELVRSLIHSHQEADVEKERLAESLDLLLPALLKLYGSITSSYRDSELLVEGTRRWLAAVEPALEAGGPRVESLVGFLSECRRAAGEGPAAEVIREGLRSFEASARRRADARLVAIIDDQDAESSR